MPDLTDAQREAMEDARVAWERSLGGPSEGFGDFEAGYVAALAAAPQEDEGLREALERIATPFHARQHLTTSRLRQILTDIQQTALVALAASPVASREGESG